MDTPVYDFLKKYAKSDTIRMHMPGHKGRGLGDWLSVVYPLDITEITGADSLFDADGILAASERNAASLFHTRATLYSTGGSTLCIQAMLAMMRQENRTVVAARNVHRSFLSACVLLGLQVQWVYPRYTGGLLSGEITPAAIEAALRKTEGPACVYVTSPDYLGKRADLAKISAVCRRHRAPLLVDNAHGAHLAFLEKNRHPIAYGADLCCDSAHKFLPALTGAAYLHIGNADYVPYAKGAMAMFGSTSPSYLTLGSLDLCNRYLAERAARELHVVLKRLKQLHTRISPPFVLYAGDGLHLTICAAESGINGKKLAAALRMAGVECEYADDAFVVLLCAPTTTAAELDRLEALLVGIGKRLGAPIPAAPFAPPILPCVMPMREAALAPYETIPVEEAVGRICAAVHVPCPPAVPIAVSGELITPNCVNIFKRYSIFTVNVVK